MIDHKNKFIFVHVPKCGGTSIESLFDSNAQENDVAGSYKGKSWHKHMTLLDYENEFPDLSDYFKFSFVRNPWSMTLSMYKYMWESDYKFPTKWRSNRTKYKYFYVSFLDWIKSPSFSSGTIRSLDIISQYDNSMSIQQPDTLSKWTSATTWSLDFIGKFENLQPDFNTICDKIGIKNQQLPHINKTNHKHYSEYYDDETREIVARKYALDIDRFGYKFRD